MERNDHKKALNCFEESLRIRKSKLVNSSQLAASFHSLGDVHRAVGNVCKSLFCYDKAIQIFTEVHGTANDRVASSLAGKGKCFNSDNQYRKALSCFSECLDVRKSIDGPTLSTESGDVLLLIGDAYSQLGDIANASTSFASALAIYRQTHGSQPQIVADVLQKMADHYVKVGEFECGYSCVNEALAIRKELVGDDDITMGDSLYCQGRILYEWKNDDEAIHCFERAREIYQKVGNKQIGVANSNFYRGCISGK
jgi:tetratricopeptide (TPR) repeat protein